MPDPSEQTTGRPGAGAKHLVTAGFGYTEGQQNGPRLVTEGLTHHFEYSEGGLA